MASHFKSVTCTQSESVRRVRSAGVTPRGTLWGVWGRFFGWWLFRQRDVCCLRWSEHCALFVLLRFVLVSSCVGASWSWWLVLVVMVLVAGWRCSWCSWSRWCGCACACGPLAACLPWVCVGWAWVWAVGRSGELSWLLVVGCVWRMSSGLVVVGGVAHACPCRVRVDGPSWWLWWCPAWGAGWVRMVGVVVL